MSGALVRVSLVKRNGYGLYDFIRLHSTLDETVLGMYRRFTTKIESKQSGANNFVILLNIIKFLTREIIFIYAL